MTTATVCVIALVALALFVLGTDLLPAGASARLSLGRYDLYDRPPCEIIPPVLEARLTLRACHKAAATTAAFSLLRHQTLSPTSISDLSTDLRNITSHILR